MKKAVFPGSFDPITRGHMNILERSIPLFDEVVVAVGVNSAKTSMFSMEKRLDWLGQVTAAFPSVSVQAFEGLTSAFCEEQGARWLIRGVRNGGDFEYERTIAQMTKSLNVNLETVILFYGSRICTHPFERGTRNLAQRGRCQRIHPR